MNHSIIFLILIALSTVQCNLRISENSKEVFGFTHFVPESIYKNYTLEKISVLVFLDDHIDQAFIDYVANYPIRTYLTGRYPPNELGNNDFRDNWVKNITTIMRIHKINGLNFDFTAPIERNDPRREQLTELIRYLKDQLYDHYAELSVSVPWSPINKNDTATNGQDYDYLEIIKIVDFILINSFHVNSQIFVNASEYDDEVCLAKSNQGFFEAAAGLLKWLSINDTQSSRKFDHDQISDYVVNDLTMDNEQDIRNKIIFVFPWFGLNYNCNARVERQRCLITPVSHFNASCSDKIAKEVKFGDIMHMVYNNGIEISYDPHSRSSYLEYRDNSSIIHQLWFDYTYDYILKYKYVNQFKLRGMGVMALDYLDYKNEHQKDITSYMWQLIPKSSN